MAGILVILRVVAAVVALAAVANLDGKEVSVALGAVVYKVGDKAGWTTIGNVDYKQWSALKSFQLGDVIQFEYNAQFHNVMQVTHGDYKACNTTSPKATYTSGNDSITITNRGHHFFLCGVPGHCQSGQKLDINVPRLHPAAATTSSSPAAPPSETEETTTSSSSSPSSSSSMGGVSGPSPNHATSTSHLRWLLAAIQQGVALAFALYI